MIFVRHGRAVVNPNVPTHEWPLDPAGVGDIEELRAVLPHVAVVCSDMRRAFETARLLGEPLVDPRLREVSRAWTDDLEGSVARYLHGEPLDGWEPQDDARARIKAAVDEHGYAVYVSHGTVLSLYLGSVVPALEVMDFWSSLSTPDAWKLDGERLTHLVAADRTTGGRRRT